MRSFSFIRVLSGHCQFAITAGAMKTTTVKHIQRSWCWPLPGLTSSPFHRPAAEHWLCSLLPQQQAHPQDPQIQPLLQPRIFGLVLLQQNHVRSGKNRLVGIEWEFPELEVLITARGRAAGNTSRGAFTGVPIEDLGLRGVRIQVQESWALGDISGSLADWREPEGEGDIDVESQLGIVAILDDDAQALLARRQDLLQPTAAVWGRCPGLPLHVRQASRHPRQLIRALLLVLGGIPARSPAQNQSNEHHEHRRSACVSHWFRFSKL